MIIPDRVINKNRRRFSSAGKEVNKMGKKLYLLFFILFLTVEIYSQDGWFWQNPSTTGNPLNDVCFIDANNGWAVGEYGTIIRTTDGGDNWTVQLQGKTYALNGVYFTDANNGTVVGVGISCLILPE